MHDNNNVQQCTYFGKVFLLIVLKQVIYFCSWNWVPNSSLLVFNGSRVSKTRRHTPDYKFKSTTSRDITLDPLFLAEEMSGMTGPVMILASWLTSSARYHNLHTKYLLSLSVLLLFLRSLAKSTSVLVLSLSRNATL